MSIIWLDNLLEFDNDMFEIESQNLLIYLNILSFLSFIIYSFIYKSDLNLSKPPSKLY